MSLLWAGYVNIHISIGWHRTKGRGVLRQNRQVAPVCKQTAEARTAVAPQCSLKFPQLTGTVSASCPRAFTQLDKKLFI